MTIHWARLVADLILAALGFASGWMFRSSRPARQPKPEETAPSAQVIGHAIEHSIEDPFTGEMSVRFRLADDPARPATPTEETL